MFYIYILYSPNHDKYYVGYTQDISIRIAQHNESARNTFTSKYRPWTIAALFECSTEEAKAVQIERFIKKQKSKNLLKKLVSGQELSGVLAQLVRVPHVRD